MKPFTWFIDRFLDREPPAWYAWLIMGVVGLLLLAGFVGDCLGWRVRAILTGVEPRSH